MAIKTKSLFDFLNMITVNQKVKSFDGMSDIEKNEYKKSMFMINRFLSMNPVYLELVDLIQQYQQLSPRSHYLFLSGAIPSGKQYNKYIKNENSEKYESWLVDLIARHYYISKAEATEYLFLYYRDDKESLRKLCESYGIDDKLIKKARL